ncbi:glycoside hydrolase family 13 protein [Actinacidiphila guanduensis]|uniref:Alpha-glucosidase n=1 Tax=Actinacidiphila guanduensis TaxID=310781 RepID=A0A1H0DBB8_9ACTN|nr:alpha-amylase family glycosyl hydrolase [Actinacidiphila guanduensis]SDN67236.1 alpha-glucosidase [Actinacidiphila guanduensis]
MADTPQPEADENWWRGAVIYQVYPRSFADSNGDGTGDLAGVRARLPYLAELGVNALWFNPWYPSPMADGGYDVADYRDVEPVFGTLAEAEKLISEALALGIRTIIDIVPNHISAAHPWFREALAAGPGSPARERFWFRPGRGEHGELPPNNWPSQFGGPAWTRTTDPDGTPGDWFLNLFDSEQPDLNWNHPEVRAEHEDILRFWFDRGAGGVRIDSAAMVWKDPLLPDLTDDPAAPHPYIDRDELHDIYRGWRRIADSYPGARILVGEVWLPDAERFARYLRPDEMHTAFNFDFLACPWEPARLRTSIDTTLAAHAPVSAPATWVLCNHDVTRTVTRYGRADTGFDFATKAFGVPTDLELGTRRARAAALLTLALPGTVYLYQGEELGLPEVEDIPTDKLQDPMYLRSLGTNPGRDGCRVPLPWSGDVPPFGFSPAGAAEPWLPQPADWAARTAELQAADPASMLSLYRAAVRLRRELQRSPAGGAELGGGPSDGAGGGLDGEPADGLHGALSDGRLEWLGSAPEVLAFRRGGHFACVVNLGAEPAELPPHTEILLTSGPLAEDGRLPQDTAVWLHV